jgi:hypothetical protein
MAFKHFRGDSADFNLQGHYFRADSGFISGSSINLQTNLQPLQWKVGTTVTATFQTIQWQTYSPTQVNVDLQPIQWIVFTATGNTLQPLRWLTYNPVSVSLEPLKWLTYAQPSFNLEPLKWNTYNLVTANLQPIKWNVVQNFTATFQAIQWRVFQSVGPVILQPLQWATGGYVNAYPVLKWNVGGRIANPPQFSLRWRTGGTITSNQKPLQWGVNGGFFMAFGLEAYKYDRLRIPNNINYKNYRFITVENNDAGPMLAGTTVDLLFNHAAMVTSGECNEFGDDLRLCWSPTYAAEQEIDAEIINPNTTTAILRFKLMAGIPGSSSVQNYRLYTGIVEPTLFEETFRAKAGIYYFFANRLSSQLSLVNGNFSNSSLGIRRASDGNQANIGFNVPENADVEVDFRFLDAGGTSQAKYIALDWRGQDNTSTTTEFRLDNDTGGTDNQITSYFNGASWNSITPVQGVRVNVNTLGVQVNGHTITLLLNGSVLATVTDVVNPIGGMRLKLPSGVNIEISAIRVKNLIPTAPTLSLGSAFNNIIEVKTSTALVFDQTTKRNIQSTVLRIKRYPDGHFLLEDARVVSEWGDAYPATLGQVNGSFEVHLFQLPDSNPSALIEGMTT